MLTSAAVFAQDGSQGLKYKYLESKGDSCCCGKLFPGAMLPPTQIMLVNILTGYTSTE